MSGRRGSAISVSEHIASSERRSTTRYEASGTPVVIGWGEGEGRQITAGTLINISLGGCAVQVTTFPPNEGDVWIRLTAAESTPWIRASVVETIKRGRFGWTRRFVRLRFVESCPYDLFKAAIEGFTREVQLPDFEAKGYSIRDWR
jgi:hypothetical protein